MTKARLQLMNTQSPEQAGRLKERIETIIEERRVRTVDLVEKTLIFHTEMGATQVPFDELYGVHRADAEFVAGWLKEQGFTVKRPRLSNRMIVVLQVD